MAASGYHGVLGADLPQQRDYLLRHPRSILAVRFWGGACTPVRAACAPTGDTAVDTDGYSRCKYRRQEKVCIQLTLSLLLAVYILRVVIYTLLLLEITV